MSLISNIKSTFCEFDINIDDNVLGKLEDLAIFFSFDADEIVNEWLAYQSSHNHCHLTITNLEHFKHEKMNMKNKENINKTPHRLPKHVNTADDLHLNFNPLEANMLMDAYGTPGNKNKVKNIYISANVTPKENIPNNSIMDSSSLLSPSCLSPISATPSKQYSNRKMSGAEVLSFGKPFNNKNNVTKLNSKIKIDLKNIKYYPKKYMFQKSFVVSEVMDNAIHNMAETLKEHYSEIQVFSPLSKSSQQPVHVIGQVCSTDAGKISAHSLMLQGDRARSSGSMVALDVSKLNEYSFFPGQIIAFRGINPNGQKFVAEKIYENVKPQTPPKRISTDINLKDTLDIFIASGPFTTSDTLSFEPLMDLMKKVEETKPDVAILIGPIIDCSHADIRNTNNELSLDELQDKWFEYLKKIESETKLVLIPSQKDVCCHPVFPQPPYTLKGKPESIYLAGDPCFMNINGVEIAVTSNDILLHLSSEEICLSATKSDRISRLANHVLLQHSLYPLYPPNESVNVDWGHAEELINLTTTPNILILPSNLKTFISDLNGCICVNPGRLAKGAVGGTYTHLHIEDIFNESVNTSAKIFRI